MAVSGCLQHRLTHHTLMYLIVSKIGSTPERQLVTAIEAKCVLTINKATATHLAHPGVKHPGKCFETARNQLSYRHSRSLCKIFITRLDSYPRDRPKRSSFCLNSMRSASAGKSLNLAAIALKATRTYSFCSISCSASSMICFGIRLAINAIRIL